jgi:hypothetical protein
MDNVWLMVNEIYPLVMTNIAMENGAFIVDLPINSMVIVHSYVAVYQRVLLGPTVNSHLRLTY